MTKNTITSIWIAGLIVLVAGLVLGGIGLGLMLAYGGHYIPSRIGSGYDFVPRVDGYFWTTIILMIVGFGGAAVGATVQLAAWIGALVNTYPLQDRTWFIVLLAGGVIGLAFSLVGFAAMVAYIVGGPDGAAVQSPRATTPAPPAQHPATLVPTS